MDHAGHLGVDAIARRAIGLGGDVQRLDLLPDQAPL
jgi:hypothetical protein